MNLLAEAARLVASAAYPIHPHAFCAYTPTLNREPVTLEVRNERANALKTVFSGRVCRCGDRRRSIDFAARVCIAKTAAAKHGRVAKRQSAA